MTERARDYYAKMLANREFPTYSNSELAQLQQKALVGDKDAWEAVWLHGVRMVLKLTDRLYKLGILYLEDLDDAVQEGNLAIGEAIPSWSNNRGRYSTYVWTCIRNAMVKYSSEQRRGGVTGDIDWDLFTRHDIEFQYEGDWKKHLVTDLSGMNTPSHEDLVIDHSDLQAAACELTDRELEVVDRYYFRDQSDAEVAIYLGVERSVITKQRNSALSKLRMHFFQ